MPLTKPRGRTANTSSPGTSSTLPSSTVHGGTQTRCTSVASASGSSGLNSISPKRSPGQRSRLSSRTIFSPVSLPTLPTSIRGASETSASYPRTFTFRFWKATSLDLRVRSGNFAITSNRNQNAPLYSKPVCVPGWPKSSNGTLTPTTPFPGGKPLTALLAAWLTY